MASNGLITRRELADVLGVYMGTVTKWEHDGLPIGQRGRRGKPSLYSEEQVRQWLEAREQTAQEDKPHDVAQERARKERAQAILAEQKYKMLAGELLPREDVEKVWAGQIMGARSILLTVPQTYCDRIYRAATLEGIKGVEISLSEVVREVLRELTDWSPGPGPRPPAVKKRSARAAAAASKKRKK